MTNNPIELLISLAVNNARTKENVDESIKALKKHYERNPLLLNVDFDKAGAISKLQNFVKELNKETINLQVNVSDSDINRAKSQAQNLKGEFQELGDIIKRTQSGSSKSFDLDLDRVLVQLENLGRKGVVASEQITKFQARLEALRQTNDRLSLKEIVVDIFDITSSAGHADKVLEQLNQALIKVGQSQQKLGDVRDKFNLDPNTNDEYIRLSRNIEEAIQDVIRLQSVASSGGADEIKLARDLREIQQRINEAKRELQDFNRSAKADSDLQKLVDQAKTLHAELSRAGNVDVGRLDQFSRTLSEIQNDSGSATAKINQLTTALNELRQAEDTASRNNRFEDQIDRQATAIDKLEQKLLRIATIHRGTVDRISYNELTAQAQRLSNELRNLEDPRGLRSLQQQYRALTVQVDHLGASAATAARASQGMFHTLGEAFRKFPVWVGTAALIYTPIRGIQDLTEKAIELDTVLTQLNRVMDAPSYRFEEMLQEMIQSTDTLAGKTSDYMELYTQFARTGVEGQQLKDLTDTATILQNISELTPDESVNSLTAAMTAFGESTGGALRVADRLNEIDNNFAITTKDLALSLNKAASTAKTFNVSLDEMLGYATAIGVATRESGNIVGNSLKTIFSRITTNSQAIGALADIGISITDQAGDIRNVSDIISELAGKWDTLSSAEQQNTAVRVAGTNQLSRFNALLLNYDTAVKATETSINSQNSAMAEQTKYAESLQARINRLETAWYGFASVLSDGIIYDGIVVLTSLFKGATEGAGGIVQAIGALGPIAGVVGVALVALSSNFRNLVISMGSQAKAALAASGANTILGRSMALLTGAATALRGALAGIAASLGVGAVFFALGFAIEKVTSAISANIQEQEKFEQQAKINADALGINKARTEELIAEYNRLSALKAEGTWNVDNEQEYLQVQNQLAEIFPAIVDHIDSTGQAHIKTTEAIKEEIEATKSLAKEQQAASVAEAPEEIDKIRKEIDGFFFESVSNFLYGSLESRIKQTRQIIESLTEQGLDTAKYEFQLLTLESQVAERSQKIKDKVLEINAALNSVNDVELNPELAKAFDDLINSLDISKLDGDGAVEFAKNLAEIQKAMAEALKAKDEVAYNKSVQDLAVLTSQFKKSDDQVLTFSGHYSEMLKEVDKTEKSADGASDGLGNLDDSLEGLIDTSYEYKDIVEATAGVTQKQIDDTNDLLFQFGLLSTALAGVSDEEIKALKGKQNLTAEQQVLIDTENKRNLVLKQLQQIYPDIISAEDLAKKSKEEIIAMIEREKKANEVLLKATQLAKDGKLTAEQERTVATAKGTYDRIELMRKEIAALILLQEQMYNTAMTNREFLKGIEDGSVKSTGHGFAAPQAVQEWEIDKKTVDLMEMQKILDGSISSIDNFTKSIESSSKSSKSANKETEKSIYLSDKYKQQIDAINLSIAKQKALMDEQYKGSNTRRLALQEQIRLEEKKLAIMQGQEKSLKNQLATGKIQQTGNVKVSATQNVKGGQRIGGAFDSTISSTFGSRADNHRGVDFAAPKGTAVNSPTSGKVIAAGDAKSQGWHWSYGNLVVVQDDSGVKHIMAHLEDVFAKVGDQIVAGVKVGTVGSTGNSTGPHLHYEQNKNGKVLNPNATVQAIRNGTLTTQSGSSTVGVTTGQEAVDKVKGDINSIGQDILNQQKLIRELNANLVDEVLANYENRKAVFDRTLQNSQNNLKKLTESSEAYRFELDKQGKALLDKRKVNQEELVYLQNVIAKGKLSDAALYDLKNRLQELKNENADIDTAISDNYLAKIQSLNALLDETSAKYEKIRSSQDKTIEYLQVSLGELDSTSLDYVKALEAINSALREKQSANRKELNDLNNLIKTGKVYGEALEKAKDRVLELQTQVKQLQLDIQEGNFEILITIKNQSDEVVDNIQFEISRLEEIRKMYEQGSGDYLKYTGDLIKQQEALADQYLQTRDALLAELKVQDISKERIKEIKELLEDEHIAYLQATNAIKEYQNQLEDANKSRLETLANDVINALKAAYQELRDEHIKSIDDMLKKEQEAHEKRLKQLKDEQDLFRKNVEERLRLIDRQEAQRTYDMEIEELEKQRSKVQERLFTLQGEDTYEAKKERKKLQEELDKIDKDIAEKRHDRDIELQKQGLNDLLELKDQEIEGKVEAENESYQNTVDAINREKAYWEKHYQDLLNDERKFAQIREDIMNGHFDKVEAEMREHINNLTATLPQLADTLDGTMRAVGTVIRQNVIDNLQSAIDKINEFKNLSSTITGSFTDNFNPNSPDIGSGGGVETSKGNLSGADKKVLLGKFLYDNVAPALTGSAQVSARNTGRQLGQSGYSQGATIDEGLNFGSAIAGLTSAELEDFKKYLRENLGLNGGAFDKYIEQFIGGNSDISNTVNRFGVQTPMSYGDMQVMMAKYMRELLISPSSPQAIKDEIQAQANQLASSGRSAGSKISSDVTYGAVLNSLDKAQKAQFKSFLSNQSGIIKNQDLKNKAKNYAASLDTGGMLNFSGAGIDGKGGKLIIAHDGEVVNNPIETGQLLNAVDSSRVMLQHLNSLMSPLRSIIDTATNNVSSSVGDTYTFNFNGDFINANKTMMERLAGSAMEEARAKKGMFNR